MHSCMNTFVILVPHLRILIWCPKDPVTFWCAGCALREARLSLGYEELALEPEPNLSRLCCWLQITFDASTLSPHHHGTSHQLAGNRVRFDPLRSGAIQYDWAWMKESSGLAQMVLALPWVGSLDQRLVYSA